jgi:hypothetical protein
MSLLGSGRRSIALRVSDCVVKEILGTHEQKKNVGALLGQLRDEYTHLKKYLDFDIEQTGRKPYVLDTDFVLGNTDIDRQPKIYIVQPRIEGISFEQAIIDGLQEGNDLKFVKDFLRKSIHMWKETGFVPDLFGKRNDIRNWYNPMKTRNILVQKEEGIYHPTLIDTNFTVRAHKLDAQFIHNPMLTLNMNRLLRHME